MIRKFWAMLLAPGMTLAISLAVTFTAVPGLAMAEESGMSKVNGSINIGAGEHRGNLSTVNGSIHIGTMAAVGKANTVNGSLNVDSGATAGGLTTVNGAIDIRDGAHVQGNINSVNGSLHVDQAADVTGNLSNVNGSIRVAASHVGGSIDTYNGSIELGPNAHIDGDVHVEKDNSWHFGFFWGTSREPRVVVAPGTVVRGKLRFEREVKLYVSDRATIGAVEGAEVIKFSGDHPPE
jgi:cytoskeletal protein CcmA (bactofilin family)